MRAVPAILLLAAACGGALPPPTTTGPPLRGIDFLAALVVEGDRASGTLRITNRLDRDVALEFADGCVTRVRLYDPVPAGETVPVPASPPRWEEPARPCAAVPARLEIPGHGVLEMRIPPLDLAAIRSETLPAGPYRATVVLRPRGRVVEIEAGAIALP